MNKEAGEGYCKMGQAVTGEKYHKSRLLIPFTPPIPSNINRICGFYGPFVKEIDDEGSDPRHHYLSAH